MEYVGNAVGTTYCSDLVGSSLSRDQGKNTNTNSGQTICLMIVGQWKMFGIKASIVAAKMGKMWGKLPHANCSNWKKDKYETKQKK